jgi:hypothetical protein
VPQYILILIFVFILIHLLDRRLDLIIFPRVFILVIFLWCLSLRTEIRLIVRSYNLYVLLGECRFDERCGGE